MKSSGRTISIPDSVKWIELHFTSITGKLHRITCLADNFKGEHQGKLDGSSIEGFSTIDKSDLIVKADESTFAVIPWDKERARFIGKVYRGYDQGRLERDPRYIAERAEKYLKSLGYVSYWGPEVEFFIFDKVIIDMSRPEYKQAYEIVTCESAFYSTNIPFRVKGGYYVHEPMDKIFKVRHEIAKTLTKYFNILVEAHHHEVAAAGQCEIDFKYDNLVRTADNVQTLKYVARNIAAKYNMVVTFMPKPIYGDNGSGMHVHVSLWDTKGRNLFYDPNDEYAELSQLGRYFIGGLLEHARSISAIVSPTTNSYKRLMPGFEAPVYLTWSKGNRSAAIRIPVYHKGSEELKRIEYRPPDPSANPYLAFAAILAAGLDGLRRKIDPGDPVDKNVYHLAPKERKELGIGELPRTLWEALDELESDHDFLYPIFTKEIIETYIEIKRKEVIMLESYPTPVEFYYYFNA